MSSTPEPAIWSLDSDQPMSCFYRCKLRLQVSVNLATAVWRPCLYNYTISYKSQVKDLALVFRIVNSG